MYCFLRVFFSVGDSLQEKAEKKASEKVTVRPNVDRARWRVRHKHSVDVRVPEERRLERR
jgi:hypothetical protein